MNVRSQDRERWTRFKGTFDEQRMKITGTIPGIPVPIVFVRDDRPAAKPGIDVQVPEGPTAFQGRGQTHLVYELRIGNSGR